MDIRTPIPDSGFIVKPTTDGNLVLLGDPLSVELVSRLAREEPIVELWVVWRASVGNVALLRSLPHLQRLHVVNRTDADLSGIAELKALRTLTVESGSRFDVDLNFWPRLEELAFLWHGKFCNLQHAFSLASLRVWSWKERDLARLEGVPRLRTLKLVGGSLRTLSGIEACAELQELELAYITKLTDMSALSSLRELRVLKIDTCRRVTTVDAFASLPRLETLRLDNLGQVSSLSPLSSSPKLRKLFFTGSTNIVDGDTDIVNRLRLVDFGFQRRKHYNYTYNPLRK